MEDLRLGFLASHNGSNMQAIVDACNNGALNATPSAVISNNSTSGALKRARRENIPYYHMSLKTHSTPELLDKGILKILLKHSVNLIILAGYMKLLGHRTVSQYRNRILNIHPALLPKFGGKGYYGRHVHKAVLTAGEPTTGVTIHLADNQFDHGPTVAQCEVRVLNNDTVESLSQRVLIEEHRLYVKTLQQISRGDLDLNTIGNDNIN